ncbi:MurR/RpiR family transcriptional regulator [Roseomonas terrae]|uniref:MurR/RpiR family transcriptional regulator n=1 Tax=Neoroseomonas terrae TaxID=424799 RepID=A0ABS5EIG6_9PROT|nr:MurR/RpiR family transcriptional regulator [Neoroseomonas terrae]MBR0650823.1 MurR/RpiR family transcriptional regulator [Neoroseomonas terrae]
MHRLSPDLERRIAAAAERLGERGRAVAALILEQPAEVALLTATKVAERLGISESTVVRFAQAVGFAGYPALRKEVQDQVRQYLSQLGRVAGTPTPRKRGHAARESLRHDSETLRLLAETLPTTDIEGAVGLITGARRVYVIGVRSVFGLADMLAFHLRHLVNQPILLDPARGTRLDQMIGIGPKDAIIALSFPRYSRMVEGALRIARQHGARSLVITDGPLSPLAPLADILFTTGTRSAFFGNSLTGAMALVNALLSELMVVERQRTVRSFRERDAFAAAIRHIPIDGDEDDLQPG